MFLHGHSHVFIIVTHTDAEFSLLAKYGFVQKPRSFVVRDRSTIVIISLLLHGWYHTGSFIHGRATGSLRG